MGLSTAAQDMHLGPVYVYLDGIEIGKTKGGTVVQFGTTTADLSSDQDGVIDRVITDQVSTVQIPVAEVGLQKLALVTGQTFQQQVIDTVNKMCVAGRSMVGKRASAQAKELILKKVAQGTFGASTDPNDWFTFPNAWPDGNVEQRFGTDQTIYQVTFFCVPDENGVRYYVGDKRVYS